MGETTLRAPSRDETGRLARAELNAAALMLMQRTLSDRNGSRPDAAFASSVRAADADLWASVASSALRLERVAS